MRTVRSTNRSSSPAISKSRNLITPGLEARRPEAADGLPLLHSQPGDAPRGGMGPRPLSTAVPDLEDERLVVGHALVQLALRGDPEVAPLRQVDRVAEIIERALAVVQGRIDGQLGMVLKAVDPVLQVIADAADARAVAAEDSLDQLVGGVELVRAVPATEG